jgi:hypothetical protein
VTSVTLEFEQGRDIDAAAVDVQAALLRAARQLPVEMTVPPAYRKVNPADAPVLFLAMTSPSLSLSDLNDYAEHLISPTLSTLDGVAQVNIFGQKRFAVRVRVQPDALAARNISLDELTKRLALGQRQHAGRHARGAVADADAAGQPAAAQCRRVRRADRQQQGRQHGPAEGSRRRRGQLRDGQDGGIVQRRDVDLAGDPAPARCQHGQGRRRRARQARGFQSQLPQSVRLSAVNDRSVSVRAALHDVTLTMLGTIVLVVLVIFLFLRRFVATAIPTLSLPVSLVGAVSLLWAFGYTIDNISLLGLTLAVGLVVDDAIVMLENIMRHVENGEPPFQAALRGSREVGFTIISISSSLVAVFIPIFFMPGRDRPALPRVRGHRRARHRRLGVRLADAGADAGEPLPERRGAQEAPGRDRPRLRARLRLDAVGLYALARRRAAPSRHRPVRRLAHLRRHGVAVRDDPEGLLPGRGHRPDQHLDRGGRGHLVSRHGPPAGARRRAACATTRRSRRSTRSTAPAARAARRTSAACSSTSSRAASGRR